MSGFWRKPSAARGAVVAYFLVDGIESLLPVSFAFAADALLALVAVSWVGVLGTGPVGWG